MALSLYAVSRWAKSNPWPARGLIVISHLLLMYLAWYAGTALRRLELILPSYWLTGALICSLLLIFLYPDQQRRFKTAPRRYYIKQKRFDFSLLAIGFFMLTLICNRGFQDGLGVSSVFAVNRSIDMVNVEQDSCASFLPASMSSLYVAKDFQGLSKKEMRQTLKQKIKSIRNHGEMSDGVKALLVILTILAAAGLMIGVVAWSCSLSCSGYEAAASIVLIGGITLTIFLAIIVIRSITRKHRSKTPAASGT